MQLMALIPVPANAAASVTRDALFTIDQLLPTYVQIDVYYIDLH